MRSAKRGRSGSENNRRDNLQLHMNVFAAESCDGALLSGVYFVMISKWARTFELCSPTFILAKTG